MAGIAVQHGRTFRTDDYLADDRFPHVAGVRTSWSSGPAIAPSWRRRCAASTARSGRSPSAATGRRLRRHQAELLQALADQAAITIQNARLIAELNRSRTELRRRAEEEQSLREIAARISATKGARDVLQRTVDEAARLLAADEARIDLIEPESGLLRWAYHSATTTPLRLVGVAGQPGREDRAGGLRKAVIEAGSRGPATTSTTRASSTPESSDGYVAEIGSTR